MYTFWCTHTYTKRMHSTFDKTVHANSEGLLNQYYEVIAFRTGRESLYFCYSCLNWVSLFVTPFWSHVKNDLLFLERDVIGIVVRKWVCVYMLTSVHTRQHIVTMVRQRYHCRLMSLASYLERVNVFVCCRLRSTGDVAKNTTSIGRKHDKQIFLHALNTEITTVTYIGNVRKLTIRLQIRRKTFSE